MPSFAKKCWARSSIPFWQKTTLAPAALTFMTMSFSILSSSAMNWDSWLGSVIWILASISVFLTSNGASIRAI